jgi:hypothetical protein
MNLETLRQKILGQTKTVEVGGDSYRLAKFGALDGLEVNAILTAIPLKGEGDDKTVKNPEDLVRLYSMLLSKSIVDEAGNKTLDSDEGRSLLERMPRDEFMALGEAAADWNLAQKKS